MNIKVGKYIGNDIRYNMWVPITIKPRNSWSFRLKTNQECILFDYYEVGRSYAICPIEYFYRFPKTRLLRWKHPEWYTPTVSKTQFEIYN